MFSYPPVQKPSMASQRLLNEVKISATHSRCSYLNLNYSVIFLFYYSWLFKLDYVQSHIWPTLSCIYATAHTVPSRGNALLYISQILHRLCYKSQLKIHEFLNEVSLFPWSRNNLSLLPIPISLCISLLKLIIFYALSYNYFLNFISSKRLLNMIMSV